MKANESVMAWGGGIENNVNENGVSSSMVISMVMAWHQYQPIMKWQ
jgi:hypothetical protein